MLGSIVAILMLATPAQAAAQAAAPSPPFDAQARVTEALAAIRPIAYHRDTLDWSAIEARARKLAADAKDEVDLLPAYQALVWYLDDRHSHIRPSPALQKGWQTRYGDRRLLPDSLPRPTSQSAFRKRRDVEVRALALDTGRAAAVIVVPSVQYVDGETSAPYGNQLYAAVAAVEPKACGFIVDVRGNTGGDMWPMVTGLSDLIGDGYRFGLVDAKGRLTVSTRLSQGVALADPPDPAAPVLNRVQGWRAAPAAAVAPVAVLMDDGTASSGESVVLALKGRPGTRLFGQTTAGLASSNEMIDLSDGMRMLITTAMVPDRTGAVYPAGVAPDEPVAAGPGDPVLDAARAWLGTQGACRGA